MATQNALTQLQGDLHNHLRAIFDVEKFATAFDSMLAIIQDQQSQIEKLKLNIQEVKDELEPQISDAHNRCDSINSSVSSLEDRIQSVESQADAIANKMDELSKPVVTEPPPPIEEPEMKWSVEDVPVILPEVAVKSVELVEAEVQTDPPLVEEATQTIEVEPPIRAPSPVVVATPPIIEQPRSLTPAPMPPIPTNEEIKAMVIEVLQTYNITSPIVQSEPQPANNFTFVSVINDNADKVEEEYNRLRKYDKHNVKRLIDDRRTNNSRRRFMSLENLPFLTPERRHRILSELRAIGIAKRTATALKIEADRRRLEAALSMPDRVKEIEKELMEMNSTLSNHKRALERIPLAMRTIMPKDFRLQYNALLQLSQRIESIGGIDSILKRINDLQDAVTDLEQMGFVPSSTAPGSDGGESKSNNNVEGVRLYDSRGRLLESIMRCIRAQIGPVEPDTDSAPMIDIQKQLHEIREGYVSKTELHYIFDSGDGSTTEDGISSGKVVHADAIRLRNLISNMTQRLLDISMNRMQSLQMRMDPAETKKILAQAETITNNAIHAQAQDIQSRFYNLLGNLEQGRIAPVETMSRDNIRAIEDLNKTVKNLQESTERLTLSCQQAASAAHGDVDGVIKNQLENYIEGFKHEKEQQATKYKELSNELHSMQDALTDKPDKHSVDKMMILLETAMKRRLGENVTGLRQSVVQIVKAVQAKAGRDEVAELIAKRVADLESTVNGVIVDDTARVAMATRCLSCGQTGLTRVTSPTQFDDDCNSVKSEITIGSLALDDKPDAMKEFYAIASGRVGLRPLSRQGTPHLPKNQVVPRSSQGMRQSSSSSSISSEPLYRKARTAAHMKEMVKVPMKVPSTVGQQTKYHFDDSASQSLASDSMSLPQLPPGHKLHSSNGFAR